VPRSGLAGVVEQVFASAGLPAPRPPMIECESFNGLVAVITRTDMLALLGHRLLGMPLARDLLQEVPVKEALPSFTHGIFMRVDARPTRTAAAMLKVVGAVARRLASRK
jgi:hypothetical protein